MLKVTARPQFKQKVDARVPIDGGFRDEVFHVTFRLTSQPEAEVFTTAQQDDFLRDVVVELHDLADENGNAIPYSDAVRDQVFELPWAKLAIFKAYFAAVRGERPKN
jgi:hypothetical protein